MTKKFNRTQCGNLECSTREKKETTKKVASPAKKTATKKAATTTKKKAAPKATTAKASGLKKTIEKVKKVAKKE